VIAGVLMHVMGDLTGRTLVVLDQESAYSLCELLPAPPAHRASRLRCDGAIHHQGNREHPLFGVHERALRFLGMMLVPSVPALVVDLAGAVLTTAYLNFGHERDALFCVETTFRIEGSERALTGQFLLMPDPPALQAIFDSIRIAN
jgi:chemotaxis protein CheC